MNNRISNILNRCSALEQGNSLENQLVELLIEKLQELIFKNNI